MNRGAMKVLLKRYGFDDSDPLDDWLNAGMHELERAKPWAFIEDLGTVQAVSGSSQMFLSPYNKTLLSLKYTDANYDLDMITVEQYQREVDFPLTAGRPQRYCIWSQPPIQVKFDRLSDQNYILQSHVRMLELDINSSDAAVPTWIPPYLHYAIVVRAAAIALNVENQEDRAAAKLAEFNDMVEKAWSDVGYDSGAPLYVQDVMS